MSHRNRPNRPTRRRSRAKFEFLAVMLLTLSQTGCQYAILLGYLIGGPPSIEPAFDAETQMSMTDKDVRVAVVCSAPLEVKYDFAAIDHELAKHVAYRLHGHKIAVVNPDRINAWLDENADWDEPTEIGAALNVTYVIYIDLHKFSLYEENSSDLYRGRSEGEVSVWKMDDSGDGEKIYRHEITSKYPLQVPKSTYETSYSTFKRAYLARLSEEIGRLFYEYYNGDDFVDAT